MTTIVLRRPRVCDRHHARRSLAGQVWDAVRHGHTLHVCTRTRLFQHGHRGRCLCRCGVKFT